MCPASVNRWDRLYIEPDHVLLFCSLCCTSLDPNIFPEGQLDFKSRQAVLATEVASGSERNVPTEDKNVPVEQNRLFQASERKKMPRDQ